MWSFVAAVGAMLLGVIIWLVVYAAGVALLGYCDTWATAIMVCSIVWFTFLHPLVWAAALELWNEGDGKD